MGQRAAFCRLTADTSEHPEELATRIHTSYRAMLADTGVEAINKGSWFRQSRPYCLLVTRQWMLLVPRSREFFEDISVNSLGFAGGLLVRNEAQVERVRTVGPMRILTHVAIPR